MMSERMINDVAAAHPLQYVILRYFNVASAHLQALAYLQRGSDSAVLNFGYGRGYSVREVIEAVKQASGVDFAVRIGKRRAGDPARLVAANASIKAAFGWQPRGTSLDEITRSALAWEKRLLETTH